MTLHARLSLPHRGALRGPLTVGGILTKQTNVGNFAVCSGGSRHVEGSRYVDGSGISRYIGFLVLGFWFLGFLVSGFLVSWFLGFHFLFLGFLVAKILQCLQKPGTILPNFHFMSLIDIDLISKIFKTLKRISIIFWRLSFREMSTN